MLLRRLARFFLLLSSCYFTAQANATIVVNGLGPYLEFNEPVMILKLETESPSLDAREFLSANVPKKLSLRILKTRSSRQWNKLWLQNLSINSSADQLRLQGEDLILMTAAIKGSLEPGDLIEFIRLSEAETRLSVNEIELASFETPYFFEFLQTAWIGGVPPSGKLKAELLGQASMDSADFDALTFNQSAIDRVQSWVLSDDQGLSIEQDSIAEAQSEEIASSALEIESVANIDANIVQDAGVIEEAPLDPEPAEVLNSIEDEAPTDNSEPEYSIESLLEIQRYQKSVVDKINLNVVYPRRALSRGIEGSLRIGLAINEDGSIREIYIAESAGQKFFDKALIAAAEDAAPFDPLPSGWAESPMIMEAPFSFRLQR